MAESIDREQVYREVAKRLDEALVGRPGLVSIQGQLVRKWANQLRDERLEAVRQESLRVAEAAATLDQ